MNNSESILLIGAGYMAVEYAKVLKDLKKDFVVIGRGEKNAQQFEKITGIKVITGGLNKYLSENNNIPSIAIVALSEEQLGSATILLLKHGVKLILVEKPAGLDFEDIKNVNHHAQKTGAKVYVGYNRRFYASTQKAQEIITQDGGVSSIFFDFTEAVHKIVPLVRARGVKENWFLQNSTHVIDLAFFLGGLPKQMFCLTSGSLSWHPKAAIFSGAGLTQKNILFSYHANWESAGRWAVEIMTKKHKLIFKPLEKLQIQNIGSFDIEEVSLTDKLDIDFKPGIYKQIESFLGDKKDLCTISEQVENIDHYKQILDGKT